MNEENKNQEEQQTTVKEVTYCPRCGAEVNPKARYCMKCGYLNKEHEENQEMKKYIKAGSDAYQVGSGQVITSNKDRIRTTKATETGNRVICFMINYSLYLVLILLASLKYLTGRKLSFDSISTTNLPFVILIITFFFLVIYGWQLIFQKCNRRWWIAFIPVYNIIVLSEVVYKKPLLGLLSLIPVVNVFYMLALFYEMGQKFRKSGFLTALFPFIMIPVIGFGESFFTGINYAEDDKSLERNYLRKRIFLSTFSILSLFSIVLIAFGNKDTIKQNIEYAKNYYYVYATNQIIKKTRAKVKTNYVGCEYQEYQQGQGVYYFYYPDLSKRVVLIGDKTREAITAYVKVEFINGEAVYYVSMSDGIKGFPETRYEDINVKMIQEYPEVIKNYNSRYECTLTY